MEVLGAIAVGVGFIIVCILDGKGKGSGNNAPRRGDLKIGRDMTGTYYVYDHMTGEILHEGTKADCARYIRELVG